MRKKRNNLKENGNERDKFNNDRSDTTKSTTSTNTGSRSGGKEHRTKGRNTLKGSRDSGWYGKTPELIQGVTQIPFNKLGGMPIYDGIPKDFTKSDTAGYKNSVGVVGYRPSNLGLDKDEDVKYMSYNGSSPGIMVFDVATTIGEGDGNVTSSINLAARKVYSYVRQANAGAKNYDYPDLMMYLMSMDSILNNIHHVVRALGYVGISSIMNRYYDYDFLESFGFEANQMVANYNKIIVQLNMVLSKLSTLAMPFTWSLYSRHKHIFSNVFLDAPNERAQVYIFRPKYSYVYDEYTKPAKLQVMDHNIFASNVIGDGARIYITDFVDHIQKQVDLLVDSQDISIMCGDIIKAYGVDGLMKFDSIVPGYVSSPIYDLDMLTEIENMMYISNPIVTPIVNNPTTNNLEQSIMSATETSGSSAMCRGANFTSGIIHRGYSLEQLLLNFHVPPQSADILNATRFKFNATIYGFYDKDSVLPSKTDLKDRVTTVTSDGQMLRLFEDLMIVDNNDVMDSHTITHKYPEPHVPGQSFISFPGDRFGGTAAGTPLAAVSILKDYGTEVIVGVSVGVKGYHFNASYKLGETGNIEPEYKLLWFSNFGDSLGTTRLPSDEAMYLFRAFNQAPPILSQTRIYYNAAYGYPQKNNFSLDVHARTLIDYDIYTIMQPGNLKDINRVVILNLFNVPGLV